MNSVSSKVMCDVGPHMWDISTRKLIVVRHEWNTHINGEIKRRRLPLNSACHICLTKCLLQNTLVNNIHKPLETQLHFVLHVFPRRDSCWRWRMSEEVLGLKVRVRFQVSNCVLNTLPFKESSLVELHCVPMIWHTSKSMMKTLVRHPQFIRSRLAACLHINKVSNRLVEAGLSTAIDTYFLYMQDYSSELNTQSITWAYLVLYS